MFQNRKVCLKWDGTKFKKYIFFILDFCNVHVFKLSLYNDISSNDIISILPVPALD